MELSKLMVMLIELAKLSIGFHVLDLYFAMRRRRERKIKFSQTMNELDADGDIIVESKMSRAKSMPSIARRVSFTLPGDVPTDDDALRSGDDSESSTEAARTPKLDLAMSAAMSDSPSTIESKIDVGNESSSGTVSSSSSSSSAVDSKKQSRTKPLARTPSPPRRPFHSENSIESESTTSTIATTTTTTTQNNDLNEARRQYLFSPGGTITERHFP
jgi:hypothetical protein